MRKVDSRNARGYDVVQDGCNSAAFAARQVFTKWYGWIPIFMFSCVVLTSVEARSINVEDWALTTSVGSSPGGSDGDFSGTPQNPYQATQSAVLGISTSVTVLEYRWTSVEGHFLATAAHAAAGHPNILTSASGGVIWFSSASDQLITIDGSYTYDLGPGDRTAELEVHVAKTDPTVILYSFDEIALPIIGEPANGTFAFNEAMLLPAGETYRVSYIMQLRSFGGSPDVLSFGDGHVNFHLAVVPECSTLALLLAGLSLACRRPHRR